ncbi:hypothetical protein PF005_g10689 [Phytophthora fragariae]|nr:hypothetical protein PF009_g10614 [Phytophthora fragariae]KAE9012379.1 hypothetical protein PF011_g8945 [Phytophthora fragariae]KAE9117935.1 hypothetical protein PF010_g8418 [Phytophthora fragariae]KAE9146354.1 hypothetical protein PF006_g8884 [Phytophthora fragariae]KAE9212201.1 hypothetical protein PF005_g10689 [Phytophthora fragariae]
MRNTYGQAIEVRACIIDGCTDEFLLAVDFTSRHKTSLYFKCNKVRYREKEELVVIPFRTGGGDDGARVAAVKLTRRVRLARSTATPVEVIVAAPDGEEGIFVSTEW